MYSDSSVVGGAETVARAIVGSLGAGFEPIVAGVESRVVAHIASGRAGVATTLLDKVAGRRDLRTVARHAAALRELRADVVHIDRHLWSGQYGVLAAAWAGVPALCVVHGVLPASSRSQRLLTVATSRLPVRYVGVSQYVSRQVRRQLHVPAGRVHTVYNGIGPSRPPASGLAASRPDPSSVVRAGVLFAGRLAWEKGADVLVRAMATLPEADAVLVGDGPERHALEALASGLGVAERVRFEGWVERWSARYSPEVVVVPSRYEAMPLVVLEAMRAGLPVIATRVGGTPEVVADSVTGHLVAPDDPAALARAIGALLPDRRCREDMGAAGRARLHGRFDLGAMVASYEGHYAEVARRPTGAARARGIVQVAPPEVRRRVRRAMSRWAGPRAARPGLAEQVAAAYPGALDGRVLLVGVDPPAGAGSDAARWVRWGHDPRALEVTVLADLERPGSLGRDEYDAVLGVEEAWATGGRGAVLANLWRALRPGGSLLVVTAGSPGRITGPGPSGVVAGELSPAGPVDARRLPSGDQLVVRLEKAPRVERVTAPVGAGGCRR